MIRIFSCDILSPTGRSRRPSGAWVGIDGETGKPAHMLFVG